MDHAISIEPHNKSRTALALNDVHEGIFGTTVWLYLAWQEIKQRYRRSLIGPFWMTISTGVMLGAMGPLYGRLFHQEVGPYFQHLAVSFVVWIFISNTIIESCTAFTSAEGFIKDVKLPFTTHLMRALARNLIMFAHNLPVVLIVLLVFPPERLDIALLAPVGLLLVFANLFWLGLVLAILCARFRDIPQIVASVIQVAFFLTPIVWQANMLGPSSSIINMNPLFHLVDVIRSPMLGHYPGNLTWCVLLVMAVVGWCLAIFLFGRFRPRIAYWI
jgi:ABC-type polysaccharide/polyol phosphate export permease